MCSETLATVFAPVCTGFEQFLKDTIKQPTATFKKYQQNRILSRNHLIERCIKRDKHWTDVWKPTTEQYQPLIQILSHQHNEINFKKDFSWNKNQVKNKRHLINFSILYFE